MNTFNDADPARIEMWGDIQCSWCYIQLEILKMIVSQMDGTEIKFRTYSEFPHVHMGDSPPDDCFREYQIAVGRVAAEMDLEYDCIGLQRTDSQSAHELVHFASGRGKELQMVDRLYRAHFADGLDVGELEVLGEIAAECGLDRNEATVALEQGWCSAEVEQDNHLAYLLGVSGVPFVTVNGKYSFSGVQTPNALQKVLNGGAHRPTLGSDRRDMRYPDGHGTVGRLTRGVHQ